MSVARTMFRASFGNYYYYLDTNVMYFGYTWLDFVLGETTSEHLGVPGNDDNDDDNDGDGDGTDDKGEDDNDDVGGGDGGVDNAVRLDKLGPCPITPRY